MGKISSTSSNRLRSDYLRIKKDPVPYITAEPLPANILEWHYVVEGPENSPYEGGCYHGKLCFPMEYPFKPPSIYMITPSGRFKTNTRLCLSISDFHPDTWNPAWSVATILTGLLSFMLERSPTYGSFETSDAEKKVIAAKSLKFNLENKMFCALFPDTVEKIKEKLLRQEEELAKSLLSKSNGTSIANGAGNCNDKSSNSNFSMSLVTNIMVITVFVIFAWFVRTIILGLSEENS